MQFPHSKREGLTHGYSPGNGMTPMLMSQDPIATEGEATPGPDDVNPYDDREYQQAMEAIQGDDPGAPEFPALNIDFDFEF